MVSLLTYVRIFATPWTAARQASLSITNSRSVLKLMFIESVMPSNSLILCHLLLLRIEIIYLCIHTSPLLWTIFFSHLGHHRALSRLPWALYMGTFIALRHGAKKILVITLASSLLQWVSLLFTSTLASWRQELGCVMGHSSLNHHIFI